jgi:hypothetical protein
VPGSVMSTAVIEGHAASSPVLGLLT